MADKKPFLEVDKEKLLSILVDIEFILISLHEMGSYNGERLPEKYDEYCKETTAFIDDNKVTDKLARMRAILSKDFRVRGEDDMTDAERAMEKIEFWSPKKSS